MGKLYIVATPIGNLEDITLRALRVLKEVDVILCEDTRVTKRLLERHGVANKQLTIYNEQRSGINAERIIRLLKDGKNLALVSDAGTPGISDPGAFIVAQVLECSRKVQPLKVEPFGVEVVPGPSALTAALSIAGLPVNEFVFLGFLPHKKGRETLFKEIAESARAMIFYESPHRILKALESLIKFAPNKRITIARELTKIHEETKNGTPAEMFQYFKTNSDKVRGEFVFIVSAR